MRTGALEFARAAHAAKPNADAHLFIHRHTFANDDPDQLHTLANTVVHIDADRHFYCDADRYQHADV